MARLARKFWPTRDGGRRTTSGRGAHARKTNANVMLIPGYVATFTTSFPKAGDELMPCHEYCGPGHAAMWAHVQILPRDEFMAKAKANERMTCVRR